MTHPIQPLQEDAKGVLRFKQNAIVRKLLDVASAHGCSLNDLACMDFSREDHVQLAQLTGYSLSGFGGLAYVNDEDYETAQRMHEQGITETQARIAYLQEELDQLRTALAAPMARLFGKHPDDLLPD